MRLDKYLVQKQYVDSRNAAHKLIKDSLVKVNHVIVNKPNYEITNQVIEIINPLQYVSRGGTKLAYAVVQFKLDLNQATVLDLGASTGGFTDVCLQYGAKKVFSVDVGHDQLALKLRQDQRVVNLENINVKDLNQNLITDPIDFVVSDLSFISSQHMFSAIKALRLKPDVQIISLIKPQFELTPALFKKHHGIIKDNKLHNDAIQHVQTYAKNNGFKVLKIIESPIQGAKKGNKEFLIWCQHG